MTTFPTGPVFLVPRPAVVSENVEAGSMDEFPVAECSMGAFLDEMVTDSILGRTSGDRSLATLQMKFNQEVSPDGCLHFTFHGLVG